jgi:hypothetical protein
MATPNTSASSETRTRYWFRVLRPLSWWVLLVLMLYGIRTHQRLMQQTRLHFSVSLAGRAIDMEASPMLDGKAAFDGQQLSLGNHNFTVTHPKGESFSTNLFIWYRGGNFGGIDLKRAKGVLAVTVDPPAPRLSIRGPEFSVTLTNSSGLSTSVPTDQYTVEAHYRHCENSQRVTVFANTTTPLTIAPRLGALRLECDQSDTTFQLRNSKDQVMETGYFPVTIVELPEGRYHILASHHNHPWTERPEVKAGATNSVRVEIKYGTAVLRTKPSGAVVTSGNGLQWGLTPLQLTELQPGTWNFTLRLDNYEPVAVSLDIVANETKICETNLTSESYTGAMHAARKHIAAADYNQAVESIGIAMRSQPDDAAANDLLRETKALAGIDRAVALGAQSNYTAGIKELTTALAALPDNDRAKQMLAEFKKREPEQLERIRVERLNRPKKVFERQLKLIRYSDLFDSHEFRSAKSFKDVSTAIFNAFQNERPEFRVTQHASPEPETFFIEAVQELSTALATSAGRRQCVIIGGQTKDDETQILCKILEFKTEAVNKLSIGALIGAPGQVNYVPIHASPIGSLPEKLQIRVREGVSNVTARIQRAIGQTPAVEPTATK